MRLVGLVNGLDHPSYRYRLRAFEGTFKNKGWEVSVHVLPRQWLHRLLFLRSLRPADVVLLQRRLLTRGELFVLRRVARRLVYDFDDAVFYRSFNSPKGPHSWRRKSRFRTNIQSVDAVIAGNAFLAEFAAHYVSLGKIHKIPTCVDPEDYACAAHDPPDPELVWIGSASTLKAIHKIAQHLEAVAGAVPGVRLKIICDVFPKTLPITVVPCRWSAQGEAGALASACIGISWMPDDLWSQGKCGLKVLQYMAAGLPVVANPVGIHRELVLPGRTGFLAETPTQWAEAIRTLLHDMDLSRTMGSSGRNLVCGEYSPGAWADRFSSVISGA